MKQYRATVRGSLPPGPGSAIAGVRLPAGRVVVPDGLWVSDAPVRGIGRVVASLAEGFEASGLWPLVLASLDGEEERPWLSDELDPASSSDPDRHDVVATLREWWEAGVPDDEGDDDALAELAPFGREFPGLAPPVELASNPDALRDVVSELSGRLGLVSVRRPADAVAVMGWQGPLNHFEDMGALSAVLRSWEDRFAAFVVGVGFDTLTIAVVNPPATLTAAQAVAAEHFAVCADNIFQGVGSIEEYAAALVKSARWTFWWD